MDNHIDENLVKLKKLDPMIEKINANYRKVKNKNGYEKMWLPLFIYFPFNQLLSFITFGRFGFKLSKTQGIAGTITGIVAVLGAIFPTAVGWLDIWEIFFANLSWWQIGLSAFLLWYIFTIIYTFLQMPNWKNDELFHVDAYRRFRPNEYEIIEQFLGHTFTVEAIKDFILRNSTERAILELKKISDAEIKLLLDEVEEFEDTIYNFEQSFIFLNDLLLKLNENLQHIASGTLHPRHLYIINSNFCVYEVDGTMFRLIMKEFPRKEFSTEFDGNDPHFMNEPFVKCLFSGGKFYSEGESYSYKFAIPNSDCVWIITYYPNNDDDFTLQALGKDSILERDLLKTVNLIDLLESHCRILSEQYQINAFKEVSKGGKTT